MKTGEKGSDIELSCVAEEPIWFHQQDKYSKDVNKIIDSKAYLTIMDVQYINAGYYYCYGLNEQKNKILAKTFLFIYGKKVTE